MSINVLVPQQVTEITDIISLFQDSFLNIVFSIGDIIILLHFFSILLQTLISI